MAQEPNQWSPRERIPGSHDEARAPYLVADQNRTIHAFQSQPLGEYADERVIFYSQWTLEQGWTDPIDIILPPFGWLAVIKGAFLDQSGTMHIVFYGGEERDANIYYTRAPAAIASRAPAWSAPIVIGESAAFETAALAGDDQGNLYVLYGGKAQGNGLYAVHSTDGGDTWSEPTPVLLTYDEDLFVWGVRFRLYVDPSQKLHAVWAVNNSGGQGQAIYYANLEPDAMKWSEPIVLAATEKGRVGQVTEPSIAGLDGELMVVYNEWGEGPTTRMMLRSIDGGRTWIGPEPPFASMGEYGEPDFVVDSNHVLHLFLGDRARGLNLWHSVWHNGRWQEPEPVASSSDALIQEGPLTFHPWYPDAVVSQGNVILVAWETDRGSTHNGTWFSYTVLDAPEYQVVPLPSPPTKPAATAEPTATPVVPTPTPRHRPASISQDDLSTGTRGDTGMPVMLGIVPVVALIVGIVAVRQLGLYRHS